MHQRAKPKKGVDEGRMVGINQQQQQQQQSTIFKGLTLGIHLFLGLQ
jgi:hypothetical protein